VSILEKKYFLYKFSYFNKISREIPEIFKIFYPLVLHRITYKSHSIIISYIISITGLDNLYAYTYVNRINFYTINLVFSVINSMTYFVSNRDKNNLKKNMLDTYVLYYHFFLISLISSFLIVIFYVNIDFFFSESLNFRKVIKDYMKITSFGVLPHIIILYIQQVLILNKNFSLLIVLNLLWLSNTCLFSYFFILDKQSFIKLEVVGAAYASSLANIITLIIFILWIIHKYRWIISNFFIKKNFSIIFPLFKNIFKVGLFFNLEYISNTLFGISVMYVLLQFGEKNFLFQQSIMQFFIFSFILPASLSQSCFLIIKEKYKNNFDQIKFILYAAIFIYIFFSIFTCINCIEYIKITNVYSLINFIDNGFLLMFIIFLFQIFDGLSTIIIGALRGIKDIKFSVITGIIIWLVGVSAGVIGFVMFETGYIFFNINLAAAYVIYTVILLMHFKKSKKIDDENLPDRTFIEP